MKTLTKTVTKTLLLTTLATAAGLCAAQETGRVISSTPMVSQVGVPRQVCSTQQVQVQSQKSGAGGIMGAIAGGALGNSIGGGDGRAVATVIGLIGGAMLGDRIEGGGQAQTQNVQNCTTQTFYENRTTGYNVVYEYAGKQYSVQMPNDPGPFVKLQITPVASSSAPQADNNNYAQPDAPQAAVPQAFAPQAVVTQQIVTEPVYVAVRPQPYPIYYPQPYYAPLGISLNLGWSGGRGYGHGRWR